MGIAIGAGKDVAIAPPIAAGALEPAGITLRPEWGAIRPASTIIVALNALLLRRVSLDIATRR